VSLSRRDVIKTGVFAGAAVALPAARLAGVGAATATAMPDALLPKPFTLPFKQAPIAVPYRSDATCDYYKMSMQAVEAQVIPGYDTTLFGYNGSVPGPTIVVQQGRQAVVRHINNLPAVHPFLGYEPWTSVHLHGSASLPQYDGYASDITRPGEYKDYHYPNFQKARTLWYHDHGVHHTAENAYHGLVGQYHMYDFEERSLPIPKGKYDVALTIGDAMFQAPYTGADGRKKAQLLWSLANQSGHWGNVILVNGVPWPVMKVEPRKYRFRVLTAAISRSFKFSLSNGASYQVIGTDGGLMPAPVTITSHRQLSGERYEIVIDFSKSAGKTINLMNTSPTNNVNYANTDKVMQFQVGTTVTDTTNNSVPAVLSAKNDIMNLTEAMCVKNPDGTIKTTNLRLERQNGAWTVNGTTWEKIVASNYQYAEARPMEGTVEKWIIQNSSGGWFHPLHIHLVDFKVLRRNGAPAMAHERGPKDVVYTGENETIELLMRFDSPGRYMVHCHNLVHEDHDMMTQFEVQPIPGSPEAYFLTENDPMTAACAKNMTFEKTDVL
jgi:spore coat protein A